MMMLNKFYFLTIYYIIITFIKSWKAILFFVYDLQIHISDDIISYTRM